MAQRGTLKPAPQVGIVALVAAGWDTWQQRARRPARWLPRVAALAAAGALSFLTWEQSRLYTDATTLYQATLERNPGSWLAHNNLGFALLQAGRLPAATQHFEQAVRLKPDYFDAHNNLGFALLRAGRPQDAAEH